MEVRRGRAPRWKPSKPEPDVYGDLHWEINALNPRNWSNRKKWAHTLVAAAMTFTVTLASSIVAPAHQVLMSGQNTSSKIATLPLSLFLLGLAFGPFISRCCSAILGRKIAYIIFVLTFAIFSLIAGLVDTMYGILICRAFAGLLAGPALSQGCAIIAETWSPEDRTDALLFYYIMPFVGPIIGIVIGGYVRWSDRYSWTRYVVLFASAACVVPIVFISETSRKQILRRQQRASAIPSVYDDGSSTALIAPLRMMCTKPVALLLSLLSGYNFAVLYASFVAFPRIFAEAYDFCLGSQGLVFLSMIIGITVGLAILFLNHKLLYEPKLEQWQAQRAAEAEKARRTAARSTHRRTTSNFSRRNPKRNENVNNSTSLALSLKRISRPESKGTATPPVVDTQKNTSLAVAATDYLNSIDANRDRRILPERVMLVLNDNPAFRDLCAALEGYHLRFDTVQLTKALVDALTPPSTSEVAARTQRSALVSSTSLHRSAAAATVDEPAEAAPPSVPRLRTYAGPEPQVQSAPAEWRLWLALPASLLLAGSLFMFVWTARGAIHWVVPCVGIGLFAFSALIIFVATQLYVSDRYGPSDGASALAGGMVVRYLLSFAFTMFAMPMYDRLGTA